MQLAQILGAVREGWQSFDVEVLGAGVLMSGIIVGLVIWLFEIRSHASDQ